MSINPIKSTKSDSIDQAASSANQKIKWRGMIVSTLKSFATVFKNLRRNTSGKADTVAKDTMSGKVDTATTKTTNNLYDIDKDMETTTHSLRRAPRGKPGVKEDAPVVGKQTPSADSAEKKPSPERRVQSRPAPRSTNKEINAYNDVYNQFVRNQNNESID